LWSIKNCFTRPIKDKRKRSEDKELLAELAKTYDVKFDELKKF
jgi:hypothetical protein